MLEKLGLLARPGQDFQRVSEFRHVKRNLLGAIRAGEVQSRHPGGQCAGRGGEELFRRQPGHVTGA